MDIAARIRQFVSKTSTVGLSMAAAMMLQANTAQAAVCLEDFNSPSLGSGLQQFSDAGFSFSISGDRGRLNKATGFGNGELRVETTFQVLGDFVATLEVERIDLVADASVGLMANHSSFGSNDVGLVSDNFGFSRMQIVPTNSTVLDSNSASSAIIRMSRVGNTIAHEIDYGSGFTLLDSQSQTTHADPLSLSFFLRQQLGDTTDQLAWVDNFQITADGFSTPVAATPAPAPAGLALGSLIAGLLLVRRQQR